MIKHSKHFKIGGFNIRINSDIPFKMNTFHSNVRLFESHSNFEGSDIVINHHFRNWVRTCELEKHCVYFKDPWAIYQYDNTITYLWIKNHDNLTECRRKIITNNEHTIIDTYNDVELTKRFKDGGLTEISMMPTDQIFLSRALAFNHGCMIHSMGLIVNNKGFLFVGHSEAGKSTMANIMSNYSTILCDDRNIIRKIEGKFHLFGTWRCSDFKQVSSSFAPLKAIFFLNKSDKNEILPVADNFYSFQKLLDCLIKPFTKGNFWGLSMDTLDQLSVSVDCWDLRFDKSGEVSKLINKLY